jgi:hypothetical protein
MPCSWLCPGRCSAPARRGTSKAPAWSARLSAGSLPRPCSRAKAPRPLSSTLLANANGAGGRLRSAALASLDQRIRAARLRSASSPPRRPRPASASATTCSGRWPRRTLPLHRRRLRLRQAGSARGAPARRRRGVGGRAGRARARGRARAARRRGRRGGLRLTCRARADTLLQTGATGHRLRALSDELAGVRLTALLRRPAPWSGALDALLDVVSPKG